MNQKSKFFLGIIKKINFISLFFPAYNSKDSNNKNIDITNSYIRNSLFRQIKKNKKDSDKDDTESFYLNNESSRIFL